MSEASLALEPWAVSGNHVSVQSRLSRSVSCSWIGKEMPDQVGHDNKGAGALRGGERPFEGEVEALLRSFDFAQDDTSKAAMRGRLPPFVLKNNWFGRDFCYIWAVQNTKE